MPEPFRPEETQPTDRGPAGTNSRSLRAPRRAVVGKALFAAVGLVVAIFLFSESPVTERLRHRMWGLSPLYLSRFREQVANLTTGRDDPHLPRRQVTTVAPAPSADRESGFCDGPVLVALSAPEGAAIHYTTGGSTPGSRSPEYMAPIAITENTTLRFRSLLPGRQPSDPVDRTVIFDEPGELPVVMISIDPVFLWDRYSGIYQNPEGRGRSWQREAFVEYLADRRSKPVGFPVLLRIHGGASRGEAKKSFRIYHVPTEGEGAPGLEAMLPGAGRPITTLILRAGGDNPRTRLRDELFRTLFSRAGGMGSAYAPCAVYLNGRYWGIYNIRERIDEEYLERHAGPGPFDLVADVWYPVTGDPDAYESMVAFFEEADLSVPSAFEGAGGLIDIENFTDYWLFNVYAANTDWPEWNMYAYRRREGADRRWRWIAWDADEAFTHGEHNTLAWATRDRLRPDIVLAGRVDHENDLPSTAIARALLGDPGYRRRFTGRMCELLNFDLRPERVEEALDEIIDRSRADLAADWNRWDASEEEYGRVVSVIRDFARRRPAVLRAHAREEFSLGEPVRVTLRAVPPGGGAVRIEGRLPDRSPWEGIYFTGMTISLGAEPAPGYRFAGWTPPGWGARPEVSIELENGADLEARFIPSHK
ncbi:MAG: CotH kinase family protein [Candidatus Eisenbacteria bacterium]